MNEHHRQRTESVKRSTTVTMLMPPPQGEKYGINASRELGAENGIFENAPADRFCSSSTDATIP
jgi:hypothetical protein